MLILFSFLCLLQAIFFPCQAMHVIGIQFYLSHEGGKHHFYAQLTKSARSK